MLDLAVSNRVHRRKNLRGAASVVGSDLGAARFGWAPAAAGPGLPPAVVLFMMVGTIQCFVRPRGGL